MIDKNLARWEQIMLFVRQNPGATRRNIAEAIGRKKHPALIALIEYLVEFGALSRTYTDNPNGSKTYRYTETAQTEQDVS